MQRVTFAKQIQLTKIWPLHQEQRWLALIALGQWLCGIPTASRGSPQKFHPANRIAVGLSHGFRTAIPFNFLNMTNFRSQNKTRNFWESNI